MNDQHECLTCDTRIGKSQKMCEPCKDKSDARALDSAQAWLVDQYRAMIKDKVRRIKLGTLV